MVDGSVTDQGWIPEPITTDPATYATAAIRAAGTFDTARSAREEWLTYLDAWFTPDPRYVSADDRRTELEAAQLELRQSVVQPESSWDSLEQESGAVRAEIIDSPTLSDVPEGPGQHIATADVELRYTRSDPSGEEMTYTETTRVSVQVLCGPESEPAPGSLQTPGDCKVVRFFPEPVEF